MCKYIMVALLVTMGVTSAGTLQFDNLSGASVTSGTTLIFPIGSTRWEITAQLTNDWMGGFGGTLGGLSMTNSCVVTYASGGGMSRSMVADTSNAELTWGYFWSGFSLFFTIGVLALGARWVRLLMAGGNYE